MAASWVAARLVLLCRNRFLGVANAAEVCSWRFVSDAIFFHAYLWQPKNKNKTKQKFTARRLSVNNVQYLYVEQI